MSPPLLEQAPWKMWQEQQSFWDVYSSRWQRPSWLTGVPDILDPHVGAGSEEQPLDGDEEQADDVWRERHTHKEHRERLEEGEKGEKGGGGGRERDIQDIYNIKLYLITLTGVVYSSVKFYWRSESQQTPTQGLREP